MLRVYWRLGLVRELNKACWRCNEFCEGKTFTITNKSERFYHPSCFTCVVDGCSKELDIKGYFNFENEVYCRDHYHLLQSNQCVRCCLYVEGNAVKVLNMVFHPSCFGCVSCSRVFPVGYEIFYDGKHFFCQICRSSPTVAPKKRLSLDIERIMNHFTSVENLSANECKPALQPKRQISSAIEQKLKELQISSNNTHGEKSERKELNLRNSESPFYSVYSKQD